MKQSLQWLKFYFLNIFKGGEKWQSGLNVGFVEQLSTSLTLILKETQTASIIKESYLIMDSGSVAISQESNITWLAQEKESSLNSMFIKIEEVA